MIGDQTMALQMNIVKCMCVNNPILDTRIHMRVNRSERVTFV